MVDVQSKYSKRPTFTFTDVPKSTSQSPKSSDADATADATMIYETYLQRTLGKALPQCLDHVASIQPVDPFPFIAAMLYKVAESHAYRRRQKKHMLMMRQEHSNTLEDDEDETTERHRNRKLIKLRRKELKVELQRERDEEKRELLWVLKNMDDTIRNIITEKEIRKRLLQLGSSDDIQAALSQMSFFDDEDIEPVTIEIERVSRELRKTQSRLKEIRSDERRDKLDDIEREKAEQEKRYGPTVHGVAHMFQRLKQAHRTAAEEMRLQATYPAPKDKLEVSKTTIMTFHSGSASIGTKTTKKISDLLSTRGSGYNMIKERGDSKSSISFPSTGDSIKSSMHPNVREKLLAKKQLRQAVERGDYLEDLEHGFRIYATPSWRTLGLKPTAVRRRRRRGCMSHDDPGRWEEKSFNCRVFYDPEVYITCDYDNYTGVPINLPLMSVSDFHGRPPALRPDPLPAHIKYDLDPHEKKLRADRKRLAKINSEILRVSQSSYRRASSRRRSSKSSSPSARSVKSSKRGSEKRGSEKVGSEKVGSEKIVPAITTTITRYPKYTPKQSNLPKISHAELEEKKSDTNSTIQHKIQKFISHAEMELRKSGSAISHVSQEKPQLKEQKVSHAKHRIGKTASQTTAATSAAAQSQTLLANLDHQLHESSQNLRFDKVQKKRSDSKLL